MVHREDGGSKMINIPNVPGYNFAPVWQSWSCLSKSRSAAECRAAGPAMLKGAVERARPASPPQGTSRGGADVREIVNRIKLWGVNQLYVVGGNGGCVRI